MFKWTLMSIFLRSASVTVLSLILYMSVFWRSKWRSRMMYLFAFYSGGLEFSSLLSKVILTNPLLMFPLPLRYRISLGLEHRMMLLFFFVSPRQNTMESSRFDLPDPFLPVIALKCGDHLFILTVSP